MRRAGFLIALLMVAALAPRADAALPGTNGAIAYQAIPSGQDAEIYVNPTTGGTTPLTNNSVQDFNPAWSPDGTKIAFAERNGPNNTDEIYVMDSFGHNVVRLTNNSVDDGEPAWSPGGNRLLFTRQMANGGDLFVMDARDRNNDGRGDNLVRLTRHRGELSFANPAWSPNGRRIAFSRFMGSANYEIFTMRAAPLSRRNRPRRLTKDTSPNLFLDTEPDWSPDGTKIVFTTNRLGHFDIASMNADGSGFTALTNDSATDGTPVYSPDGSRIAFYRSGTGGGDIYTIDASGVFQNPNDETNTTTVNETDPSWQPQP